jgi:CheY-like chemotaxis protein
VWDSGVGIPAAHQAEIFEEFFQLDNPERDRGKGLGLGLAIADRIARLLDHRIRIRSTPGRGSMFAVDVPYGDTARNVAVPAAIQDVINRFAEVRVAVVDDENDIVDATMQLLERWGCVVIGARSGAEMLEALRRRSVAPDFLICDYQLLGTEDGLSVIRNIRLAYGESIPAVLISGNATPERVRAARDSGIDLLQKPVAPAKLRQVMQRLLVRQRAADRPDTTGVLTSKP